MNTNDSGTLRVHASLLMAICMPIPVANHRHADINQPLTDIFPTFSSTTSSTNLGRNSIEKQTYTFRDAGFSRPHTVEPTVRLYLIPLLFFDRTRRT